MNNRESEHENERTPKPIAELISDWVRRELQYHPKLTDEEISAIATDPEAGTRALLEKSGRRWKPKLHKLVTRFRRRLHDAIGVHPKTLEKSTEFEKVNRGIERAVSMGIVQKTVVNPSGKPLLILLTSSHHELSRISQAPYAAQAQLFQLLHCLIQEGVDKKNPLFLEGLVEGGTPSKMIGTIPSTSYDLRSAKGQQYLFEHPEVVMELMKKVNEKASMPEMLVHFDWFTIYRNIRASHSLQPQHEGDRILSSLPAFLELQNKLLGGKEVKLLFGRHHITRELLVRIDHPTGSNAWRAAEFCRGCDQYLQFLHLFDENAILREKEMVERLFASDPDTIPFGSMGRAHEPHLVHLCVAKGACVWVVNPTKDEPLKERESLRWKDARSIHHPEIVSQMKKLVERTMKQEKS